MVEKTLGLAVIALLLPIAAAAQAQVTVDVTKITCSQFSSFKIADPKHIAIWISGYYHGANGDPTLDTQALLANADKVDQFCFKHPDLTVLDAAKQVLGEQK